ncbi:hypothetical protein [Pararhodobacter zhoushanensis]|uniref:hypothetical protein n=1 Tax=Pararhodobacter zhoushanensis TaxID=2479545 RepID=UPI000F8D38D4|nr:hypothetical protein [Pararhodobacter zhoushanensis]
MRPDLIQSALRASAASFGLALALTLAMPAPAMAQAPGAEDLRALIYYLDHDDQRAVQAEMRRLRSAFPRWTPPTDVNDLRAQASTTGASVDVQPIWARIQRNDYVGARALIDEARARVPGWSPDAEMLRVLETSESQIAFDEAYARRDAAAAIAAVRRTPALMRCDRINNAWRLAELYQAAGQNGNAVTTYRGVVSSCTRISEVTPTLEKANDVTTLEELAALFDVARQAAPGNTNSLNELETRLRAGRGGAARTPARTAAPAAAVAAAPSAAAPVVTGGAAPAAPQVATAPGRLPLRGDNRASQVRGLKDQGNWAGCLAASANPRSIEVLYERSWCAYNLDRAGEALAGFTAASQSGSALGGDVPRDSRFGMILSYLSMNMTEEGARLAASTPLTQEQRVTVESSILDQRGVRAYHSGDFGQSIAYLTALEQLSGSLRRDLAMLRGYAYLNNDQPREAVAEFTRLNDQLSTEETRGALQSARGIMSGG